MAVSGYSHRSLNDKLGVKPGMHMAILKAPKEYVASLQSESHDEVIFSTTLQEKNDFIQCFVMEKADLEAAFPHMAKSIEKNGVVWVSWPKGSSGVPTDLNENSIREIGLKNGMVDVKVIAIDDTWSGLKFVFRLKDRT